MRLKEKDFISAKEIQQFFSITRPTEIVWRKKGILPKPVVLGRRVYYKSSEIENLKTTV